MNELELKVFETFNKGWALVTAGSFEHFNAMTVSWGGMGTLWGKPVTTVYVKPVRYTHDFLESSEYFTVSLFPEEYRADLVVMGKKSGRDCDKLAETKLKPAPVGECVGYEQAKVTLLCRKIYRQDMLREAMPKDVVEKFYADEEPHTIYIGEVLEVRRNG